MAKRRSASAWLWPPPRRTKWRVWGEEVGCINAEPIPLVLYICFGPRARPGFPVGQGWVWFRPAPGLWR